MGVVQEFRDFLQEYKVIGLAVAVVMGTTATGLVTALVKDVIMPLVSIVLPSGDWQKATFQITPNAAIAWGDFLGVFINFVIIAFVVFAVSKMVLKEEKVTKK